MRRGDCGRRVGLALGALALLALTAAPRGVAVAGEDPPPVAAQPEPAERPMRPLPAYKHPYPDGLYSTIVAMITVGAPEIEKLKKIKLKIPGFKSDLQVRAILQEKPAPLIVVLVGVDGKADTPLGRLFPFWLNDAGFNVLAFDSTFRPAFAETSRLGVTGNFSVECEYLAKIVAEFLKLDAVKKVVTRVGVVGYSLGGTQALVLANLAAEGKLPFELSGALAFSPLIKLKSTAGILDDFYAKDRYKYTMIDMGKTFLTHEPVAAGAKIPFEPAFMRAGIGFVIREEFTEIVDRNDKLFKLKQLPEEEKLQPGENRRSIAEVDWGFSRFMEKMCYPYWKEKSAFTSVDDLWKSGDLTRCMKKTPPYARAILCENDPFNSPEDLAELKKSVEAKNLIVVEHGGHLGYIGTVWCYAHLMRMFAFK